jgi:hypothetical protein
VQRTGQRAVALFDLASQREVDETQRVALKTRVQGNTSQDPEVLKNFTIAGIAAGTQLRCSKSWKRNDLAVRSKARSAPQSSKPWIAIRKSKTPTFGAQLEVAQDYLSTLDRFNRRNHVLD